MKPVLCKYVDDRLAALRAGERRGYATIEVLPELKGKPFDDVALAFIHGLDPKSVRLCRHGQNDDARTGRVNVYIDDDDKIVRINKEIEVMLPAGVAHGHALRAALLYGIQSWQVDRFLGMVGMHYDFTNGQETIYYEGGRVRVYDGNGLVEERENAHSMAPMVINLKDLERAPAPLRLVDKPPEEG